MTEIAGALLAAGAARRFGAPKQLHPLPDRVPVGVASERTLVQAVPHTLAVVQPGDRSLIEACSAIGLIALADGLPSGASMVAPVADGRRGHPVGFSPHWGDRLQTLGGDDGARCLLAEHADELVLLNSVDARVLEQIDHPDDLVRTPVRC